MLRSFRPLSATLVLAVACAAAPCVFADGAKPAAPAADKKADAKAELSPQAKAMLASLRAMSADQRKQQLAQMDAQLKVMNGKAPEKIVAFITGLRNHFAKLSGTMDALEAAKTAKDEAKVAAQEEQLKVQATDLVAFAEKNKDVMGGDEGAKPETLAVGAEAPELKIKVVSGEAVSTKFADHKGKPVVVEFWATWCPPCRQSIPHIDALWEKHKDKAVFFGVTSEEEAKVKGFVAKQKAMRYPVAIDQGGTNKAYKVNGIPHAFIVVDGKVVWEGHPMAGLDAALEKALGGKDAGKAEGK